MIIHFSEGNITKFDTFLREFSSSFDTFMREIIRNGHAPFNDMQTWGIVISPCLLGIHIKFIQRPPHFLDNILLGIGTFLHTVHSVPLIAGGFPALRFLHFQTYRCNLHPW